jgi:hypothetical protein
MPGKIPVPAYGYRITHYKNLPFILRNGIYCPSSPQKDAAYINIGNKDIIQKRGNKPVICEPYGFIHNYVSFYFGPRSPMLYSISKGNSDTNCKQEEIVYLVTTIATLEEYKKAFVFTCGQALMALSQQYNNIKNLDKIDWDVIFGEYWNDKPPEIIDRKRKRQAELLVHEHVPVNCIISLAVLNKKARIIVEKILDDAGLLIPVKEIPKWYY